MKTPQHHRSAGFSLVEVALALGIAAFCLLPVFGLLPLGVTTNRISFEQTGAANVASAVVSDLRAVTLITPPPAGGQTTPCYQIPIPGVPAGSLTNFRRSTWGRTARFPLRFLEGPIRRNRRTIG